MSNDFVYIGRKPCGCVASMVVNEPDHLNDVADIVAGFVRDGLKVESVQRHESLALLDQPHCEHAASSPHDTKER